MKIIDRLFEYIDYQSIKIYPFEQRIGVSNGYLSKQRARKADIGESILCRILENCPDLNVDWLLTGLGNMLRDQDVQLAKPDIQHIPIYDIDATGLVQLFENDFNRKVIDVIETTMLPKCDGGIRITGDSMYPLIKSGDIVFYKQINDITNNIVWGDMYLIAFDIEGDEHITVRWIHKSDLSEHIKLVSHNENYYPVDIHISRVRALAFVKASLRL